MTARGLAEEFRERGGSFEWVDAHRDTIAAALELAEACHEAESGGWVATVGCTHALAAFRTAREREG